jgi:lipopolysaccharide/colanic/teichoic acid biosynthesis glycosyltransferase
MIPPNTIMTGPNLRPGAGLQAGAEIRQQPFRCSGLIKTCFDLIGSMLLIAVLAPLFALVAILIFLDDGMPVIYRRRVVGTKCEFDAFKFRTMRRDADEILNANPVLRAEFQRNFKLKNDPRVTRIGAFLRKSSIDELPQVLNVLIGQMSLVGPRMLTSAELGKYGQRKALLLSVKPGMTGYWQVNGRQDVPYEDRVKMDIYYIEHWSLLLDLKILLLTPFKVVRGEGAH